MANIQKLVQRLDYSAMSYTIEGSIGNLCNERLFVQRAVKPKNNFLMQQAFFVQHAEVTEMDHDLEGTGLSRPKTTTSSQHEKPPDTGEAADVEGLDPEELMESAKSVKPKQVSMVEELHG